MAGDFLFEDPCPACSGRGTVPSGNKCEPCSGTGKVRQVPRVERRASGGALSNAAPVSISTDTAATPPPRVTRRG